MSELHAGPVVTYRSRAVLFEPFSGSIERVLRGNRFYEMEFLEYIEALRMPGAYVDAGAFIGTHTLFFATFCNPSRVYSFEPRRHVYQLLERNVALNGLGGRVRLFKLGLSDAEQSVTVQLDGRPATFPCKKLDDLVTERVGVIKIDVEGMEPHTLRGALRILREDRPYIFLEAHDLVELAKSAEVLEPFGYRMTGRVFNATPTYEFEPIPRPAAAVAFVERSLLERSLWQAPKTGGIELRPEAGSLEGRVEPRGVPLSLTQDPAEESQPPTQPALRIQPAAERFLAINGRTEGRLGIQVCVSEYDEWRKIESHVYPFHPRFFRKLTLAPHATRIRISLKFSGNGSFEFDRLSLHESARPP
jgi:FkbM family methyltransferase